MSPGRLSQVQAGVSGLGIRGMRELLRQFGGSLTVDSDSNGTRILVRIPTQPESKLASDIVRETAS